MTKQAQVGAFALLALLLLFGVFYIITDFGTRHTGYRIGVHFQSAAGLHSGAVVYFSGVTVGTVDSISLLSDNTVDVILAVDRDIDIPRASRFLIQAPLTGDPNLLIVPPPPQPQIPGEPVRPIAMLERRVLPVDEQVQGTNTATIADLLEQGQGEVKRLDTILADLEKREPKLLDTLQKTMANANDLTTSASSLMKRFSSKALALADTLQSSLTAASNNIDQLTATLNDTTQLNSSRISAILTNFQASSAALNQSMTSLQSLATDPKLKANVLATTQNIADTTQNIADLTRDLRRVTGNPQTQAQLRSTIANLDATMERATSLMGALGGKSSVYGVDANATPAPLPAASGPAPESIPSAAPVSQPQSNPTAKQLDLKSRLTSISESLIAIQLRISGLSAAQACCDNPLFTRDRGPQTDLNAVLLPNSSNGLMVGANDIGYNTTANLAVLHSLGSNVHIGGGLLYSQLGFIGQYNQRIFGLETRIYNARRPSLDLFGNLHLTPGLELFVGQRDMTHDTRRNTYGIQFQF